MSGRSRRSVWWRLAAIVVLAVAVLGVAVALLWPITDLIAAHDVGLITGPQRAAHLQAAREAARTQLLTLGAGIFAAGALVYTARNFTLSRRTFDLTEQGQRRTFELTEEGQVTDRYARAIDQLGSDKLDVRIGGIYAMERIARDSTRDHPTVMEVLSAFIREHSREQWPLRESGAEIIPPRATRPDVQAGLTVIGRRNHQNDRGPIVLTGANLTGADLVGAELNDAILDGANLTSAKLSAANLAQADLTIADLTDAVLTDAKLIGAILDGASLDGADLTSADLSGADLTRPLIGRVVPDSRDVASASLAPADLTGAVLVGADLTGADLTDAILTAADLSPADLTDADLTDAILTNADLTDAILTGAILDGADLTGARFSSSATVPTGWALDPASRRLERLSEPPSGAPVIEE